jgi:uroporphyrinogen decarboxylase
MERIGAVLSGGTPDRRPFTLTLSLFGARLTGVSAVDYYADPSLYAAGQRAVVDLCEPDIVFGPFALALEAEAFGAVVERFADAPPLVKKPAFKSALGITTIKRPDPEAAPHLRFLVDSVRAVVQNQQGTRPVAVPITAPCDLPVLLLGMDTWLETLLFKPELAAHWGHLATEHFLALAAAYFKAGASVLVTPVMLANPAIIHP